MLKVYILLIYICIPLFFIACDDLQSQDLLPSWNDGNAREAIITFVEKVCNEDGSEAIDRVPTC